MPALCLLLLFAAPLRADTLDPFAGSQAGPLLFTAKNWAGYVAEVDFDSPVSNSVTSVSGAWTVPGVTPSIWPAANVSGQQASSVAWVGIDGFIGSGTVEQIGTESYMLNGVAHYYAWYEMYPSGLTLIPSMSVSPGDSIAASVQYSPPGYANEFQLSITDSTNGQTYTTYQTNSSALMTSAEWIMEAPTIGTTFAPLPTFGSIAFTGAQATIGSTTGGIDNSAWQYEQVNMRDNNSPSWSDSMLAGPVATSGTGDAAVSSFTVYQTPEPSSLACLAAAAAVLVGGRWVRKRIERKEDGRKESALILRTG